MPTISGGSATTETVNLANATVDVSALNVNSNLYLTAGNGITQTGGAVTIASGQIASFNSGNNAITMNVDANNFAAGELRLTGNSVNVKSATNFTLGTSSISGSSLIWTTAGDISQVPTTGVVTTPTGSTLVLRTDKDNGSIDVSRANNEFNGNVTFKYNGSGTLTQGYKNISTSNNALPGIDVSESASPTFKDLIYNMAHGMTLGAISLAANGTLTLGGGDGAIAQASGTSIVMGSGGLTTIVSSGGAVTLTNAGNTFQTINITSSGAVSINNGSSPLTLATVSIGSLGFTAGSITVTGAALSFTTSNVAGTLGITSSGAISGGGLTVSGATTIDAGANAVNLATANNFAGLTVTGDAVTINNGTHDLTIDSGSSYTSIGATGANVTLNNAGTIAIAGISASGNLSVTATDITQTGAITANGSGKTATFDAGGGDVTLTDEGNNFYTTSITGGTIQVTGAGSYFLGNYSVGSALTARVVSGSLYQSAALDLAGKTAIFQSDNGGMSLANEGNDFGTISITAANGSASIKDANSIELGAVSVSGGNLTVYALGGAITESGALSVHNDENLALANFVATGDIVLTGASNQFDLLKFDGVSVNIMENGEMAISSAGSNATTLALRATGNISQSTSPTGGIRVTGATTLDASGAEIMLMGGNNNSSAYSSVNDFATVTIIGANKAFIGDSNAIDIAGATISGGLTATTNLYIYADGNTTQSGAITVANGYALFATGIINSSKAITLNNPANSFAEMVMLYSKAPGTHDLTLYNSFSGGTAVVSATVNRTDSTIGVLTLNVPNSNLQTSFGGMEQPGSAVLIKALNITCGSESFAGNLTQAARPWYVYDSASGAPVITLNVYGSINLTGSVHNRFNKVLILRNGTVYSINTEIPGSSKTGTTTKDNDIVDMNA